MRLSLKALSYFLTAAERGGIARAAEDLHVAPSAVAAAIDQVEQVFALKLVTRTRAKGIRPTATGQILLGKVRHLLEEYDNLIAEGGELRTALSGPLRVGYYAPVAPAFLPAVVAPLIADNPAVSLRLVECDNETAQGGLLNGDFDVILFVAENVKPGIAYESLLRVPPYLLTARDHPLARRRSLAVADLADEPLVLLDRPVVGEYYRSILEQGGVSPRVVASATTTEMVRSLVGRGLGCALLNMRPLADESYAGDRLAGIPIRPQAKPLQLVLGHLQENPRRLVRAFVEQCRLSFAGEAARALIVTSPFR